MRCFLIVLLGAVACSSSKSPASPADNSPDASSSGSPGSSGSSGSSGSAGSSDSAGAGGMLTPDQVPPLPPVVGCKSSATAPLKVGEWQEITPPQLNSQKWCTPQFDPNNCPNPGETSKDGRLATYGSNAFVFDSRSNDVFLGTSSMGIWKSSDCGASDSWTHVDSGRNGDVLDKGRNWSIVIDPTDSKILYTLAGYGDGGLFKSVNGGVDWDQILPDEIMKVTGGFIEKITLDPKVSSHIIVSFHGTCTGTALPGAPTDKNGWGCLAELKNGTWALTTNAVTWSGSDGGGQAIVSEKVWFYGTNSGDGLWRTETGGVSVNGAPAWTRVFTGSALGSVYIAKDGSFYSNGGGGMIYSTDGLTWTNIANSPSTFSMNGSTPIVQVDSLLYVSIGAYAITGPSTDWYYTAPIADGTAAGPFALTKATSMLQGGEYLDYDSAHHILYSSNMVGGFWRLVTQ